MPTMSARRVETAPAGEWTALAVFGGGVERLDGVLERAVAPAIRAGRSLEGFERWYFVRWTDERGPHLRVELCGRAEVADAVAGRIDQLLHEADGTPVRDPVLPRPASQRRGGRRLGVEPVAHRSEYSRFGDGLPQAEQLFELSSDVVLEGLPALPRGHDRVAYGLALMRAMVEVEQVGLLEPVAFWEGCAREWTGGSERGERLLESLARHARRLGPQLEEAADHLRGDCSAGLERYAEACRPALDEGATQVTVRRHVHLTNNRLGVTQMEEALLALLLARGGPPEPAAPGRPPAAERERPAQVAPDAPSQARSAPSEADEAVRVRQITRPGEPEPLLDDVSFTVRRGQVYGVLGPEGAGKSSLLGIVAGLRLTVDGSVRILGYDPVEDRVELAPHVGVALPDDELADGTSARENLELAARAAGSAAVESVLEAVGLAERAGTAAGELDLGERRRLGIGCALFTQPEVLFVDEPTAGLGPAEREAVWRVLAGRREAGVTVVLTTSSLQEVLSTCDRAALLVAGSVFDQGSPRELAEEHFRPRSVHFRCASEPDVAALRGLPEAEKVNVERRGDRWAVEVVARQPDELLALVGCDPDFPAVVWVDEEDLEATFATSAGGRRRDER
jgi:ABC-2 type transport system ATP-binding protein